MNEQQLDQTTIQLKSKEKEKKEEKCKWNRPWL